MNFETLGVFLINPVPAEVYIYMYVYIYITEIHPLAFVSCGFSSIFPFRYRNDLSLTWTSIFVQSLRFSFTTTLHRPFPNGFHLTVGEERPARF